jgi:hypothetical protein
VKEGYVQAHQSRIQYNFYVSFETTQTRCIGEHRNLLQRVGEFGLGFIEDNRVCASCYWLWLSRVSNQSVTLSCKHSVSGISSMNFPPRVRHRNSMLRICRNHRSVAQYGRMIQSLPRSLFWTGLPRMDPLWSQRLRTRHDKT